MISWPWPLFSWLWTSLTFSEILLLPESWETHFSSVIFEMKLCGKSVTFKNMVTPPNLLLGGQGLNLLCLKHNIFPFSQKKGNPLSSVTNRKRRGERFIPIVLHHNVRGNICMSPWTEIVFRFFTAKNITANKYCLGLWCIEFRYSLT